MRQNRQLKVIINGDSSHPELQKAFNERLAIALYAQLGREKSIRLLEALNEEIKKDERKSEKSCSTLS